MAELISKAKRFSQAVFEIALERKEIDKWQIDLQKIVVLAGIPDIVGVLENPKYSLNDKKRLLESQLAGINQLALNLVYILVTQNQFGMIKDISLAYQSLVESFRGIEKAEVITAIPLEEGEKTKIIERLEALTGKKIVPMLKVDPRILGGMIARVGGKIIDGSTSSRLLALKNELTGAGT